MRLVLATIAAAALTSTAALADNHRGNSDRAGAMADTLSGSPGIGGAAPSVSGKSEKSDSGWGSNGSEALGGGSVTEGAKSQGRGKNND